ncbi:MAG: PD40 domain-containing protein [Bryobacterales bacterium]|nr:PD40 domain-containing protein [Bryobacterales bacterium]
MNTLGNAPQKKKLPRRYFHVAHPLTGERRPLSFAQTSSNEANGQFSPDGRWIAYQSDESQRAEVYVARFPCPESGACGKVQVSPAGGTSPK